MTQTFKAGDTVHLYEHAGLANHAHSRSASTLKNGGAPRTVVILREHPSEPGTFEVQHEDGSSEYVSDAHRMRHIAPAK